MIMRAGKASLKSFRAVWKGGLRKRLVWTTAAVHKQFLLLYRSLESTVTAFQLIG